MDKDRQMYQMQKQGLEDLKKSIDSLKNQPVKIEGVELLTIKGEKGEPGKDGKIPEKGIDYFTKEEIQTISDEILSRIRVPEDGKDGKDAEPVDYSKIEKFIKKEVSKIPKPKDPAPIDVDSIARIVLSYLPKQKEIKVDYKKIEDFCLEEIKRIEDNRESRVRTLNSGGPTTRLGELVDVDLTNLSVGQVISWNGTQWVPSSSSTQISIGENILGGTANRVLYEDSNNKIAQSDNLFFDGTNLGVGTTIPNSALDVNGVISINSSDFIYVPSSLTGSSFIGGGGKNATNTTGVQGFYNTFSGINAGQDITTGSYNAGFGLNAGANITTGQYNMYVGVNSGFTGNGSANVGIGYNTLYQNTSSYNVAIGGLSLDAIDSSAGNVGIGYVALTELNGDGQNYNTAMGYAVGQFLTSGVNNVLIGKFAARTTSGASNVTSLSYGVYIGTDVYPSATSGNSNEIVIGYRAVGNGSNTVTIGNDSITSTLLKGNVGIGTTSPSSKLHVVGGALVENTLTVSKDAVDFNALVLSSGGTSGANVNFTFEVGDTGISGLNSKNLVVRGSSGGSDIAFSPSTAYPALLTLKGSGKVGIGTTTPESKLQVLGTTEQLRLGYDASNYVSFTTASDGTVDVSPVGDTFSISASQNLQEFKFVARNPFSGTGLQTSAVEVWGDNKARFIGRNVNGSTAYFNMGWDSNAGASGWGYGASSVAVMVNSYQKIYVGNSADKKFYGQHTISANAKGDVSSVITRRYSGTADLQQFQDENDTVLSVFDYLGRLGIGTSPSAFVHVLGTTEQLRLGYDASNYWSNTVDVSGNLNLSGSGGDFSVNTDDLFVDTNSGRIGMGTSDPAAKLDVYQSSTSAAVPVLKLNQADTDDVFINYAGTSAADQTKSISTVNGDGDVEGPKNYSSSAGWAFEGMVKIEVNGTAYWMPYYSADTS